MECITDEDQSRWRRLQLLAWIAEEAERVADEMRTASFKEPGDDTFKNLSARLARVLQAFENNVGITAFLNLSEACLLKEMLNLAAARFSNALLKLSEEYSLCRASPNLLERIGKAYGQLAVLTQYIHSLCHVEAFEEDIDNFGRVAFAMCALREVATLHPLLLQTHSSLVEEFIEMDEERDETRTTIQLLCLLPLRDDIRAAYGRSV